LRIGTSRKRRGSATGSLSHRALGNTLPMVAAAYHELYGVNDSAKQIYARALAIYGSDISVTAVQRDPRRDRADAVVRRLKMSGRKLSYRFRK